MPKTVHFYLKLQIVLWSHMECCTIDLRCYSVKSWEL